jgi:IS1 family transposase/transposase-like protein
MKCTHCQSNCKRHGRDRYGQQRWRCLTCSKTFSETHNPLDGMRVPLARALAGLQLLVEGVSVRGIERITGMDKKTILSLLVVAGAKCERLMERRIRRVEVTDVQADEIWGFVWCKQKTKTRKGYGEGYGDAYCFVAMERRTKLVLAWHLGRRTMEDTKTFTEKLSRATVGRFQITTDGWESYREAIIYHHSLGKRVDFAQIIKTYQEAHPQQSPEGERRYSPARVLEIFHLERLGHPDPANISTSHIERQNLTIRMQMRRMTRLTNAFSKKWENLRAAYALHFAYYNFCRIHKTLRCTPAMESDVTKRVWELKDLLTA